MIRRPTPATPLLHWLSTTHNVIDNAKKAFLQMNQKHNQERDEHNLKSQENMNLMNLIRSSSL